MRSCWQRLCGPKCLVDVRGERAECLEMIERGQQLRILRQHETGDPSCLVSTAQAGGGGVMEIGEHTSELQSLTNLVCRLSLEKKN